MIPPGLVISAPASGTGKTTLMLGLLAAFRAQGLSVQPFKCGPDYIDPAFHAAASGRASLNLDSWAMQPTHLGALMQAADGADLVLAEGSMGLFDGVASRGETGTGASADIAALAGWPVVLVLDVSGQAQSAAATALGFATLRKDVALAGVVLNRVASPRHEALARVGMEAAGIRVLGALPRQESVALPERHLGLVQAEEQPRLAQILAEMASFIAAHVDLPALRAIAAQAQTADAASVNISPPGNRVALARDAAFSFIYPHLLAGWRAAGAEILPFSPLADEAPDTSADACWLPGGYPELHAGRLAASARFRSGLRNFAETRPVHGECGGYMAMGECLIDASGTRYEMAGFFKLITSFEKRRMHLGYRLARLVSPIPGYREGARLRGHEFHYASILEHNDAPLAQVVDASGAAVPETGSSKTFDGGGRATGSFFHLIAEAT
ncbi:hydrogenobyrinic acid a,c-diamide synthase (glutamine-hydrolysing) /cobyrinate a,c-diamide synthase [Bradyrhizobium lablabi]|uniref:Hydrogenobyrinate a,c-diamide synthase n=2 Tax=Bradyrhizobium TaxID=374 RepID=A0ABY0P9P6_9BRAD|nr:hydrogenobyrinic acid a,c-diamide synthase (glutamine-hydrolysing) /cobyrinate a,c-diamide synthase [Bradyrhizobium ottawaense]SEE07422.1 hydrogenobyrinic acid a,c-diamide synthase (glutamine-hydrolysing) /cobyrinate a,c-diamide synthase [Bradyrhizobium lablabi]SHM02978.1 hydrogenobyrinic acid a,c-diamide synthase (glutamine-hydrolysing) /cobyrinate a,c-diamide synthase [Bradyrhizobium lablabi]